MGYGPPLPAPIPIIRTTLSPIGLPELHRFIQDCDTATLADYDDKGLHLPFFLDSLDLALCTPLFVATTTVPNRTLATIKSAHARLRDVLMQDEQETTKSIGMCSMIEEALKLANNNALESNSMRSFDEPVKDIASDANTTHPLLVKLKIYSA
jgi:hypothetical protein